MENDIKKECDALKKQLEGFREIWRVFGLCSTISQEQKEELIKHRDESTISISMPGIGPKTAFVLLAFLGNMEMFSSCRQVGYFSGFTPSTDQSGQLEHYGFIIKQGSKQLRHGSMPEKIINTYLIFYSGVLYNCL